MGSRVRDPLRRASSEQGPVTWAGDSRAHPGDLRGDPGGGRPGAGPGRVWQALLLKSAAAGDHNPLFKQVSGARLSRLKCHCADPVTVLVLVSAVLFFVRAAREPSRSIHPAGAEPHIVYIAHTFNVTRPRRWRGTSPRCT